MEDWKGRGITPIYYESANSHVALLETLNRWADLSAVNGKKSVLDAEISRIVRNARSVATDADRDLFDHIYRRSDSTERVRISTRASRQKAEIAWLDAMMAIASERITGRRV